MNHPEVVQATGSGGCKTQLQSPLASVLIEESGLVFNFLADRSTMFYTSGSRSWWFEHGENTCPASIITVITLYSFFFLPCLFCNVGGLQFPSFATKLPMLSAVRKNGCASCQWRGSGLFERSRSWISKAQKWWYEMRPWWGKPYVQYDPFRLCSDIHFVLRCP